MRGLSQWARTSAACRMAAAVGRGCDALDLAVGRSLAGSWLVRRCVRSVIALATAVEHSALSRWFGRSLSLSLVGDVMCSSQLLRVVSRGYSNLMRYGQRIGRAAAVFDVSSAVTPQIAGAFLLGMVPVEIAARYVVGRPMVASELVLRGLWLAIGIVLARTKTWQMLWRGSVVGWLTGKR